MNLRALLLLLAATALARAEPARAQAAGGIQVAPVMVTMSPQHRIASLRLRNGRDRPVSFEIDAYTWSQHDGQDVLTPTQDLIVSPGVFEIAASHEQVVRLGVTAPATNVERAYRIIIRELPSPLPGGNVLGFTLELSLPVFVPPNGARPTLQTQNDGAQLTLSNTGAAHTQIISLTDASAGVVHAPRYLLAGASAIISLPASATILHLSATDFNGAPIDRVIHVERQNSIHSG